jgi:hypothetical protein
MTAARFRAGSVQANRRLGVEAGEESEFFALGAQPRSKDAMEWDGGWVRARGTDELTFLKVRKRALHGAAGEPRGRGDGLMRRAKRPVCLLRCLAIEVKVDEKCGQAAVMAHQVGQEAVEHVGIEGDLYHGSV